MSVQNIYWYKELAIIDGIITLIIANIPLKFNIIYNSCSQVFAEPARKRRDAQPDGEEDWTVIRSFFLQRHLDFGPTNSNEFY